MHIFDFLDITKLFSIIFEMLVILVRNLSAVWHITNKPKKRIHMSNDIVINDDRIEYLITNDVTPLYASFHFSQIKMSFFTWQFGQNQFIPLYLFGQKMWKQSEPQTWSKKNVKNVGWLTKSQHDLCLATTKFYDIYHLRATISKRGEEANI